MGATWLKADSYLPDIWLTSGTSTIRTTAASPSHDQYGYCAVRTIPTMPYPGRSDKLMMLPSIVAVVVSGE